MATYNQMQARVVKAKWLNRRMTCVYKDTRRTGIVRFVKQGPAIKQPNGEYFYLNEPDGKVYIDFHQDDGKMRCFMWVKVVDPRDAPDPVTTRKSAIVRARAVELGMPVIELTLSPRRPRLID